MKRLISIVIIAILVFTSFGLLGCATKQGYQGAGAGAVLGGIAGALIDSKNPWRGTVIGAAIGAAFGGTISELAANAADDAARKAASENKAMRAETRDGYTIVAEPVNPNQHTRCKKVKERIWKDGQLMGEKTVEVCEGEQITNVY